MDSQFCKHLILAMCCV